MTEREIPDLSGLLSGLLKNPEALAALSSVLGGHMPNFPPHHEECKEPPPPPPRVPTCHGNESAKKNLLRALKPFLTPERQRAVDLIIMLQDTMELFRKDQNKKGDSYVCPSIPSSH